jgi:hypothetical protein
VKAKRLVTCGLLALVAAASGALLAQEPQAVGTWALLQDLATPLPDGASVALPDGRTLVAGGAATGREATETVTIYDPVNDSLIPAGTLVRPRAGHTATLLQDRRVVVIGGVTEDGLISTDIEIFDPTTGTSALVAQLPEPRHGHVAASLLDGTVLVAGGATTDALTLQSAVIFDPATNSVSPLAASLQTARVRASATTLLDGRVLVVGGSNGAADLASAEVYDRYSQSFAIAGTPMSVARQGHSAVLLPNNGGVLIVGGTSNGVGQAGTDLFLPAVFPDPFSYGEGEFSSTGAMTAARAAVVAGPTSMEGYAFAASASAPDAEVYRFATIKTDKDDYAPGELALITGAGWQPGEQVTLLFQEDPAVHDDYTLTLQADMAGNIHWNQWAPEWHDLGVRFYLTATGSLSRAQTTFTDALKVNVRRDQPRAATLAVASGSTTAVRFAIENDNNNPDQNKPIVVDYTLTAPGLSVAGEPTTGSVTLPNRGSVALLNFDVTAPIGPAIGLHVTLTATMRNCSGSQSVCSSSDQYTIDVAAPADSTPPVITPSISGTLGTNGWYTSDVSVTWTVDDPESTITSQAGCNPTTIDADTPGTTLACTATSAGGTSTQSVSIKRDATAPVAQATATPAANAHGWNNTDVTVTFAGTDALSGLAACDPAVTLGEGANQSATGTCTDMAGNSADATISGINIDKTAPVVQTTRTPDANANGWNNTDVTVSFAWTDTLSGPVTCDSTATFGEGASQSATSSCTDLAGNTASASVSGISIDKTAPVISAERVTPANSNGWNNTDVTTQYSASDALSGLVDAPTGDYVFTGEGADQSHTFTVTDKAGNSVSATVGGVNIDKTRPALDPTVTPNPSVSPNPVVLNGTATATAKVIDALSGVNNQNCSSVDSSSVGPKTLTCSATDNAGNTETWTAEYSIVYDWRGFLQPINDSAHQTGVGQSRFKLGQTIPAKFVLRDASGTIVQQTGDPVFTRTNRLGDCSFAIVDEEAATNLIPAADSFFKWDGTQYHYNWSTKTVGGAAGVYRVYVTLADRTQHWVDVCLTK